MGSLFQLGFVLMAVGMLIAYIGDRLGTFVGKKRISKLGLRPRHTAILYTTITGGVIPLLALFVFVQIDHRFERALTQYEDLLASIGQMKKQTQQLKDQNQQLTQKVADDQVIVDKSQKAVTIAQANAVRESKWASKRLALLHSQLAAQEAVYAQSIAVSRRQLASANAGLESAKTDLTSAKRQLASAQSERNQTAKSLKIYQQRVADAQHTVDEKQRDVDRLNNHYRTLIALNDDLQHRNDDLLHRNQQLETTNVYHTGDELGRTVLYTSERPEQIRARLTDWLESLSRTAAHRGAGTGPNGRDIVVQGDGSENHDQSIPEDDSLDTLAEHIAQSGATVGSVVVVANARFNSTLGEQVRLDLQSFDNLLVFSKGDSVASTVIDGSQPQEAVMNQLVRFVSQKLQRVAIDKAIMPTIDPSTLNRSYGQADHLLDAVAKIQEAGGSTQVVAVASDDVFTNGPLTVHLEVVQPPSSPSKGDAHPLDTAVRDGAPSVPGDSLTGHSAGHRSPSSVTGL